MEKHNEGFSGVLSCLADSEIPPEDLPKIISHIEAVLQEINGQKFEKWMPRDFALYADFNLDAAENAVSVIAVDPGLRFAVVASKKHSHIIAILLWGTAINDPYSLRRSFTINTRDTTNISNAGCSYFIYRAFGLLYHKTTLLTGHTK